jgi:hypothetical protein
MKHSFFSLLCFILTIFMSIQLEQSTNAFTWTHLEFTSPWNRIYRTKDQIAGIILKRAISRISRENIHELNCITMCKRACTCIVIHFTFNLYFPTLYIPSNHKFYWNFTLHFEHIILVLKCSQFLTVHNITSNNWPLLILLTDHRRKL